MKYPEVSPSPFKKLVNVKGFYNDEDNGWVEHQNATGRLDKFKFYELRKVRIHDTSYVMLSKHCSDRQNFYVVKMSDLKKISIVENTVKCTKIPIKYYGYVRYTDGKVTQEALEGELMNRIVYHDNLAEALQRFEYSFCVNTYYDNALNIVKFYTCLEQKSTVDEYISLKNCTYRKSYTDIFVSPELFKQRYLQVDKDVFADFWQIN